MTTEVVTSSLRNTYWSNELDAPRVRHVVAGLLFCLRPESESEKQPALEKAVA